METKDKDHLCLPLLHQNETRRYGSFEPQVTRTTRGLRKLSVINGFPSLSIRYPPLEVEDTANEAIEAILREDRVITIPNSQKPLSKFLNIFPISAQEMVRDRVLREHEFFNPNCKLNFGQE